ncbi:S8 family serine peptidase [Priestia megaterium]|uniref:S8 family serine peptidase n=1 Tax=Priestia megaterium TaxID=1404 RepID=UPI0031FC1537
MTTNDNSLNSETNIVSLTTERPTYMIAPRRSPEARMVGLQPMATSTMDQMISALGLDVIRRIRRGHGTIQTLSAGAGEATDILVAQIEPERANLLQQTLPPHLVMARNKRLTYGDTARSQQAQPHAEAFSPTAKTSTLKFGFRVLGQDNKPLSNVTVQLVGEAFPTQGLTNEKGEVQLELITIGDKPPRLLTVNTHDSYWNLHLRNPQITSDTVNLIQMSSFADTFPGFPNGFQCGWGQRLMGLDKLPKEVNGAGVKIAIIDSGCDNSHPLLHHIQHGQDFTNNPDQNSWNQDTIGHGTHCAGIIAARSADSSMMRGFAPEAEVHILRVFPGGQYSSLIEALDYCIDHRIDVVNMSLGGDSEVNPVVEEALEFAALNGVACIIAAGNSGDAVKYPARSRQAFAVAAVGNLKDLHPTTWESTTVQAGLVAPDGIFSPSFTCFGSEISVCAPGVEIISTLPGGTFGAQSGTSMAAPHVTGFAALLLAHHPLFQTQFQNRGPQRVAALFNMIRSLCKPCSFDKSRTGAGLPNIEPIIAVLQNTASAMKAASQVMTSGNAALASAALQNTASATGAAPQAMTSGNAALASAALQNTASATGAIPSTISSGAPTGNIAPFTAVPQFAHQNWYGNPIFNHNHLNSVPGSIMVPLQAFTQFYTLH